MVTIRQGMQKLRHRVDVAAMPLVRGAATLGLLPPHQSLAMYPV